MEALIKDVRYALRGLRRRPVFTAVAVLSLALGIGANGAIFSLVNGMLLKPLPGVEADHELVRIYTQSRSFDFPLGVSYPNYLDLDAATGELLADVAGQVPTSVGIAVGHEPARVAFGAAVVGDYFGTLGTRPELGRLFTGREVEEFAPVVVLSHRFWQQRMAGDPAAVGDEIEINGKTFTVVGVAPPGFSGTEAMIELDFWVPLTSAEEIVGPGILESRSSRGLRVTGRLRQGVDLETFAAALEPISANLSSEYPQANANDEHRVMPESDARLEAGLGDAARLFATILMALVGGVLLIACANVANLLLARADSRKKELSLRVAIGAGRAQLIRQQLVESLTLAIGGGLVGLGIAVATARLIAGYQPPGNMPIKIAAEPDLRVFLFTGLVALLAGLVFGLAPAMKAARNDPAQGLRTAPGTGGGGRFRLGSALVVAQVALSLVLLVAAGLFLRSLQSARQIDLGFDATGVGAITFDLATVNMDEEEGRLFYDRLEQRVAELAGVDRVALASPPPMDWYANGLSLGLDRDLGEELGDELLVLASWVGPGYFELMDTPIVAGRAFTETDDRDHPPVVIVNQALADRVWPEGNPVGRTLRLNGRDGEPAEVIGVVPTGKYRLPGEAPRPYAFLPLEQRYRSMTTVLVASGQPLGPVLERAREAILTLEPDLAIQDAQPFEVTVGSRILGPIGLVASLAGSFGLIGLVLAAIGLYGVMALQVGQRTREIGVRMALGARAREVLAGVLSRGLRLAAIGIVIGALLSFAASRVLGSFLVGVSASDPLTFVAVIVTLTVAAVLASLVPALRAAHIDPVRTLKAE